MESVGLPTSPPPRYLIRIKGKLDARWSQWFDAMSIAYVEAFGVSVLCGPITDQTALHGLLMKIRDLNLELISVVRMQEELPCDEGQTTASEIESS